jgi:chorismate mutase/prephenate dehydrogenase
MKSVTDDPKTRKEIEALRDKIDGIDEELVSLLAKRQREVARIVSLKRKHGIPVYHPAREEDLISNRLRQAREVGLDPGFVEDLYRLILRQSRVKQTAHMAQKGIHAGDTVLIVGGRGEMGQYFRRWFEAAGYTVRVLGRQDWSRVDALCRGVDLALISVPIDITTQVIAKLGPHLPARCVLADITSIKAAPLTAMLQAHPGPVVGLHPLFGPTPSTMDKQIVVVTPGRDDDACRWLIDQFAAWGSITIRADAVEHDNMMDMVQALRHFATFAFGRFLHKKGVDLHRTLEFSSPIYRLELVMVGRLFAQDPALYGEIIFSSPERRQLLTEYIDSVNENLPMLENSDKDRFCAEFTKVAEWFASFSEQALRESTYLIDKLIERF